MADYNQYALQPIRYRLNRGIPNQVILRVRPYHDLWTLDAEPGIYAQDRWTIDRLTLNLGVRYDYKRSHFPEQTIGDPNNPYGASRFVPVPFVDPQDGSAAVARHHAEDGCRLRSVRRRQDRGEGQPEQVSRWNTGGWHR